MAAAGAGVPLSVLGIDSPGCFLQVGGLDLLVAVVGAIYWHALRLWLKRTPFHDHPQSQRVVP